MQAGEIIDATFMNTAALRASCETRSPRAKADDVLFSVHLKATMMKVSDPIIFGHAVQAFFTDVFAKHGDALLELGVDPNNGIGGILYGAEKVGRRDRAQRSRRTSSRPSPTAARWRWSTPTRASPTCTCRAT